MFPLKKRRIEAYTGFKVMRVQFGNVTTDFSRGEFFKNGTPSA